MLFVLHPMMRVNSYNNMNAMILTTTSTIIKVFIITADFSYENQAVSNFWRLYHTSTAPSLLFFFSLCTFNLHTRVDFPGDFCQGSMTLFVMGTFTCMLHRLIENLSLLPHCIDQHRSMLAWSEWKVQLLFRQVHYPYTINTHY